MYSASTLPSAERMKPRSTRIPFFLLLTLLLPLLFVPAASAALVQEGDGWAPIVSIRAAADGTLYVATAERGGVYSSSNGGRNWRHIGSGISSDNFYSLRVSPQGYIVLSTFEEVLASKNGGVSWSSLKGGGYLKDFLFTRSDTFLGVHWREGFYCTSMKNQKEWGRSRGNVDFLVTDVIEAENKRLWGATFGGGVRVSDDGGMNWNAFGDGPENRSVLSLAWNGSTGTLFAGTYEGGVFVRQGEEAWRSASEGLPPGSIVQALAVAKDGSVWAGTHRDGCFVSRYGGRGWEPFPESGGNDVSVTAIEPFRDGVVIGTASGGLFYAEAARSSWRPLLPFEPVTGLVELDKGSVLALSRSGRLFRSSDGGRTWKNDGEVPVSEGGCAILLRTSDGTLLAGGAGGVYRSDGRTWTRYGFPAKEADPSVISPQHGAPSLDPVIATAESGGNVFAATWRNGLLRSRDGGRNWEHVEGNDGVYEITPSHSVTAEYRYVYALSSDGGRVAVATDRGFSASVDGGETWKNSYVNSGLFSVLFDREGTLWGVSRNGVWRCTPEDMNVEKLDIEGFDWSPFSYFTDLFRGSGGTVFGVTDNELHRLLPKDGGYVMEGASLTNIEVLAMLALSDGSILMGTSKAFYRSDDGGRTWKEIGLP